MEMWKQIEGFPLYEVSSEGRVRNLRTQKIVKQSCNQRGFSYVGLYLEDGSRHIRAVHILVAETFLERPQRLPGGVPWIPMHNNQNKQDNGVDNLTYRRRSYIWRKRLQNQREKPIVSLPIRDTRTGRIFANSKEAADYADMLEVDLVYFINIGASKFEKVYHV